MSKVLKTVGKIAGAVASVAVFIPGIGQVIGAVAGAISLVTTLGGEVLAKPPAARGSISQLIVATEPPQPYLMGETYFGGVLRHRAGWGGEVSGVQNPYLFDAVIYSGGGPVNSITPQVNFAAVTSWYTGFLYTTTKLGACPEGAALVPQWAGATGWSTAHKLSGQAQIGWSYKFDKAGKVFSGGLPVTGALVQGVKVYDPRLDSTFPGGSGACRLGTESTYVYSANPALHAGTYAYGRYQNGKRTIGIGLPADAVRWDQIAAWANVCAANGWTISGIVYEPGNRWENLKNICAAGGGEPVPGGVLGFRWAAPVVSLDTITAADVVGEASLIATASYRDRINTAIPKYTSAAHNWEQVPATPVSIAAFVTEDGETRQTEWPFNLVADKDQAAELALYRIWDTREQIVELVGAPRLRLYRAGECLTVNLPELGVNSPAVILKRQFDPASMTVRLVLRIETASKHAAVLGAVGGAPATPGWAPTAEELDQAIWQNNQLAGSENRLIRGAAIVNPRSPADVARPLLRAIELGSDIQISVAKHDWDYEDRDTLVTRALAVVATLDDGVSDIPQNSHVYIYFDDADRTLTAPTYKATTSEAVAINSVTNPNRHPVGRVLTPAFGSGSTFGADRSIGYGFY